MIRPRQIRLKLSKFEQFLENIKRDFPADEFPEIFIHYQRGVGILYTSENRALATVEYLVHVPSSIVPTELSIATIQIPDDIRKKEITISDLPANWRDYPAPEELAFLGTRWALSTETLLLRVPSAAVEGEFNILINPLHPDMKHITILSVEAYRFDKRLLR